VSGDDDDDDRVVELPRHGLYDDDSSNDDSDLGLDVTAGDLAGGNLSEGQANMMARRLGLTVAEDEQQQAIASTAITTTTPQRPSAGSGPIDEEDADRELQVLTDALWDSYYGLIWNPVRDYVSTAVVPSVSSTVRRVLLWTSSFVVLGGGIWWATESPLSINAVASSVSATLTGVRDRARQQYHHPYNSSSVWTTALVGTVGLSLYARHYYYVRRPSSSSSGSDDDGDARLGKQKKEN